MMHTWRRIAHQLELACSSAVNKNKQKTTSSEVEESFGMLNASINPIVCKLSESTVVLTGKKFSNTNIGKHTGKQMILILKSQYWDCRTIPRVGKTSVPYLIQPCEMHVVNPADGIHQEPNASLLSIILILGSVGQIYFHPGKCQIH